MQAIHSLESIRQSWSTQAQRNYTDFPMPLAEQVVDLSTQIQLLTKMQVAQHLIKTLQVLQMLVQGYQIVRHQQRLLYLP